MATIDPELLAILACPSCKTSVVLEGERIVCTNPGPRFRAGIRVLGV